MNFEREVLILFKYFKADYLYFQQLSLKRWVDNFSLLGVHLVVMLRILTNGYCGCTCQQKILNLYVVWKEDYTQYSNAYKLDSQWMCVKNKKLTKNHNISWKWTFFLFKEEITLVDTVLEFSNEVKSTLNYIKISNISFIYRWCIHCFILDFRVAVCSGARLPVWKSWFCP